MLLNQEANSHKEDQNIPDFSMWIGTPARFSYWIDKQMNKIYFNDNGISECNKFELVNNKVKEL